MQQDGPLVLRAKWQCEGLEAIITVKIASGDRRKPTSAVQAHRALPLSDATHLGVATAQACHGEPARNRQPVPGNLLCTRSQRAALPQPQRRH